MKRKFESSVKTHDRVFIPFLLSAKAADFNGALGVVRKIKQNSIDLGHRHQWPPRQVDVVNEVSDRYIIC